jgi:hypothetical protein
VGWLHAGKQEEVQPYWQEKFWKDFWPRAVSRGAFYGLFCAVWMWMNSQEDSMNMAVVHWDVDDIASSIREKFPTRASS